MPTDEGEGDSLVEVLKLAALPETPSEINSAREVCLLQASQGSLASSLEELEASFTKNSVLGALAVFCGGALMNQLGEFHDRSAAEVGSYHL